LRVAAIDIGTNTTLLLVAEADPDRGVSLSAVREEATITRLGEGVDATRKLAPAAIERTNTCLARYAEIVRELGVSRVAVVGTSAMRDAGGGDEVRAKVRELFGVDARTISGQEEASLTFHGATGGLSVGESVTVFDIGGGSTELVVADRGAVDGSAAGGTSRMAIVASKSFDVGSVRLTERHGEDRAAIARSIDAVLATDERVWKGRGDVVGIAGTVTTLAAVALSLEPYDGARVHGHVMKRDEIAAVVDRLAAMPLEDRKKARGLEPKRADVIVAGGMIALAVLDKLGAKSMIVSDRGVRWGLAESLVSSHTAGRTP
jgi:exopolyphosphatase/guanosine-5'-triphosphate,3'-diphosphate pyrophosphatase